MIALSHIEPIKMPDFPLIFDKYTSPFVYFNNEIEKKRLLINEEHRKCFVSVVLLPRSGFKLSMQSHTHTHRKRIEGEEQQSMMPWRALTARMCAQRIQHYVSNECDLQVGITRHVISDTEHDR